MNPVIWMAAMSGGATFSPSSLTGLVSLFEADKNVSLTDTTVTAWGDTRSAANDLSAFGAPSLVPLWRNGQPAILFNGTSDYLRRATLTGGVLADPFSIFVVGSWDNDAATGPFVVGHASAAQGLRHQSTSPTVNFGAGNINTGTAAPASGTPFIMLADAADGAVKIRFEANGVAAQSATSATSAGTLTGLEVASANGGGSKWAQHVAVVGVVSSVLTDPEKDLLFAHYRNKYAITPSA